MPTPHVFSCLLLLQFLFNIQGPPSLNAGAPKLTPSGDLQSRQGVDPEMWERDRGEYSMQPSNGRRQGGGGELTSRGGGERRKQSRSQEPGEDTEHPSQKRSRGGD